MLVSLRTATNPANTTHRPNVEPMLARRLRRQRNIGSTLGRCVVFAGKAALAQHIVLNLANLTRRPSFLIPQKYIYFCCFFRDHLARCDIPPWTVRHAADYPSPARRAEPMAVSAAEWSLNPLTAGAAYIRVFIFY